jgi:hypothetical protein
MYANFPDGSTIVWVGATKYELPADTVLTRVRTLVRATLYDVRV